MNEASRTLIKKGKFKEALKILAKCEEILEVKETIVLSFIISLLRILVNNWTEI